MTIVAKKKFRVKKKPLTIGGVHYQDSNANAVKSLADRSVEVKAYQKPVKEGQFAAYNESAAKGMGGNKLSAVRDVSNSIIMRKRAIEAVGELKIDDKSKRKFIQESYDAGIREYSTNPLCKVSVRGVLMRPMQPELRHIR